MKSPPVETLIFPTFGIGVLEHLGEGSFQTLGAASDWLDVLFTSPDQGRRELQPEAYFLESFLYEAQEHWEKASSESLRSGIWMEPGEEGKETPFEAFALHQNGRPLLLIQNLSSVFPEKERVLQLARDQLLMHEKLRHEVLRKEVLVHCIIHDLNGPIASLQLAVDLLEADPSPERIDQLCSLARRQIEKQKLLVEDILETYKAETQALQGGIGESLSVQDLAGVLDRAKKDLTLTAERNRVEIRIDIPEGLETGAWTGSASRLHRVVMNFSENALRLSPPDSELVLGLVPEGKDLLVVVDDQGPGLDEGAEHTIFERMKQGRKGGGKVGLGLYYCRITARAWGGDVGCKNRESGGARFFLRLVPPPKGQVLS